jgi:hypothetical protein
MLETRGRPLARMRGRAIKFTSRSIAVVLIVVLSFATAMHASGQADVFADGAPGLGDPFFPLAGNGGYDVKHYSLTLAHFPRRQFLKARATIDARATEPLERFDLDLRGFSIEELLVNGEPAEFSRRGQELIITPAAGIAQDAMFHVDVVYRGKPRLVQDPDKSYEGWAPTRDGALAVGEPQGSPAWYPVNDYPTDKATFDFHRQGSSRNHGSGKWNSHFENDRRKPHCLRLGRKLSNGSLSRERDHRQVQSDAVGDGKWHTGLQRGGPKARRRISPTPTQATEDCGVLSVGLW